MDKKQLPISVTESACFVAEAQLRTKHIKLEYQICSLELAQQLKELGVKQESLFYWFTECSANTKFIPKEYELKFLPNRIEDKSDIGNAVGIFGFISAFSVAELGILIGNGLNIRINMSGNIVVYHTLHEAGFTAETIVDAMAKMLIYLIENNLRVVSR